MNGITTSSPGCSSIAREKRPGDEAGDISIIIIMVIVIKDENKIAPLEFDRKE